MLTTRIDEHDYGSNRDQLCKVLADNGIQARTYFTPTHSRPEWQQYKGERYLVAEDRCKRGCYLPSASSLKFD